jgi:tRNA-Thr(GGU) m(6)t(6)A37 methyltransferase TsaA
MLADSLTERLAIEVSPVSLAHVALTDQRVKRGQRDPDRRHEVNENSYEVKVIGRVESPLTNLEAAPKQGDEGAPDAWLVFEPAVLSALEGIRPGDKVTVLTWLHHARRDVLKVHPRGDVLRAQQGVFSTRSPHRPNPIGLHPVEIVSMDGGRVRVRNLEALDGTPIVDLKPELSSDIGRR